MVACGGGCGDGLVLTWRLVRADSRAQYSKMPLHYAIEKQAPPTVISLLVAADLPVSRSDGSPSASHAGSFYWLVKQTEAPHLAALELLLAEDDDAPPSDGASSDGTSAPSSTAAPATPVATRKRGGLGLGKHIHALVAATEEGGRTALEVATEGAKRILDAHLHPSNEGSGAKAKDTSTEADSAAASISDCKCSHEDSRLGTGSFLHFVLYN